MEDDHWAFLEEIEAPMWVDLALEASNYQNIDDPWFRTSHWFHQCSSRQLKSEFSGNENASLDCDLFGSSSPKLPSSVSKSRGKEYNSKKWRGKNQELSLGKAHPVKFLNRKPSFAKQGPGDKTKHKSSFTHLKKNSSSKSSFVCHSSLSGNDKPSCSNPLPACEVPAIVSSGSSMVIESSRSNATTSTVTSESDQQQQQQKHLDLSSQALGQRSELLSVLRRNLRKSNITRPALRVEIKDNRKQSRGRNSTSSKSSVGSSSNPGCDARISTSTSRWPKESTPDSRNVEEMTNAANTRINHSNMVKTVKTSTIKLEERASNNRRGGKPKAVKLANQEAAKQKVGYQTSRAKALRPSKVNQRNPTVAATKPNHKAGVRVSNNLTGSGKENLSRRTSASQKCNGKGAGMSNRLIGSGKENVTGRIPTSHKCNGKGVEGGDTESREQEGTSQEGTSQCVAGRNDIARVVRSKKKGWDRGKLEKPKKMIQKVHFR